MNFLPPSFIQAPAPLQTSRQKSLLARRKTLLPHRPSKYASSTGRALLCCQSPAPDQAQSTPSFSALEAEIRAYLESCADPGPSPLAYLSLGRAGRTDLISKIMACGGYIAVSERLGIPVDKASFIPPPSGQGLSSAGLLNPKDDGASLKVGRDLEARLRTVEHISRNPPPERQDDRQKGRSVKGASRDRVPSGAELRRRNEDMAPPVVEVVVPEGERLTLTVSMRAGLVLLAGVSAVGFGRASVGFVDAEVLSVARAVAQGLGVAHAVVAVYAAAILAPRAKRNAALWFIKVLLSGPAGVRYLRSLGSL